MFENQQPTSRFVGPADRVLLVMGPSTDDNILAVQNEEGETVFAIDHDGNIRTKGGVFYADETSIER